MRNIRKSKDYYQSIWTKLELTDAGTELPWESSSKLINSNRTIEDSARGQGSLWQCRSMLWIYLRVVPQDVVTSASGITANPSEIASLDYKALIRETAKFRLITHPENWFEYRRRNCKKIQIWYWVLVGQTRTRNNQSNWEISEIQAWNLRLAVAWGNRDIQKGRVTSPVGFPCKPTLVL